MNKVQKLGVLAVRLVLGWMFVYAGITKIIDSGWSAAGYIGSAKTFPQLFNWFLQPDILPIVNIVNEWGLLLLGLSLITGIWIRVSAPLGALLMLMYYLVVLQFPYPNPHSFIVDDHIVYAAVLLFLATVDTGFGVTKK